MTPDQIDRLIAVLERVAAAAEKPIVIMHTHSGPLGQPMPQGSYYPHSPIMPPRYWGEPIGSSGLSVTHASDCALHNMPAYPAGDCTCGATQ